MSHYEEIFLISFFAKATSISRNIIKFNSGWLLPRKYFFAKMQKHENFTYLSRATYIFSKFFGRHLLLFGNFSCNENNFVVILC